VFQTDQSRQLARRLHVLKNRTNRSYEALARRVGVSSSTLHRYCSGEVVPPTVEVVMRFGKVCGATREEAEELLRCWALAVDRDRARPLDVRRGAQAWFVAVVAVAGVLGVAVWRRSTR
jgi:transcriptional regulator with XRE-family HTH domain